MDNCLSWQYLKIGIVEIPNELLNDTFLLFKN